jgi:hypothetical protein
MKTGFDRISKSIVFICDSIHFSFASFIYGFDINMNPVKPTIFQSWASVESTDSCRKYKAVGPEPPVLMPVGRYYKPDGLPGARAQKSSVFNSYGGLLP